MKPKLLWSVASLALGLLLSPCFTQASFLDDIAGNNTGHAQTYTSTVTQPGQRLGPHAHATFGDCLPLGLSLAAHIDHARLAPVVDMAELFHPPIFDIGRFGS